jgi:hypothetical protein
MPDSPLDPANLQGDALTSWYLRTPTDIEQERQMAATQRYQDFFGGGGVDTDPRFDQGSEAPAQDVDPGISGQVAKPADDIDPGFSWIPDGPNRWRRVNINDGASASSGYGESTAYGDPILDRTGAGPNDGGELIDIGNPANRRLRREYEQRHGPWPKTDDGRNYHVAHKRAIADGGTNTLDNIEPMHPDEHIAQHINSGDAARWGRRPWIARAFGGRVEPPTPGLRGNSLGVLGIIPNISGVASGRIRTDTPTHFWYDMAGFPAPDDIETAIDPACRAMGIAKPGLRCA